MDSRKQYFLTFLLISYAFLSMGQGKYTLELLPKDTTIGFFTKITKLDAQYADSIAVLNELKKIRQASINQGYLVASIDNISWQSNVCQAAFYLGPFIKGGTLNLEAIPEEYLSQVGFRKSLFDGKPVRYEVIAELQEDLLVEAENNGFPFAYIYLDSISYEEDELSGTLKMDRNQAITIGELTNNGNASISSKYLQQFLGMKKGEPYDKSKVIQMRPRLKTLLFLKEKRQPYIKFKGDKADIELVLDKRNANKFDFLLGLLPNPSSQATRRYIVTGEAEIEFNNQFGVGERIYAKFQQLRPETQELKLEGNYPYILDLPFGVDGAFSLYKRDTNYRDLIYDIGVQYLIEGGNYLKVFWNNQTTDLLSINEASIIQNRTLPNSLDVSYSSLGIEYYMDRLNYRFNPTKGWQLNLSAKAGLKKIDRNDNIVDLVDGDDPTFDFGSLYDSLDLSSFQYAGNISANYFIPILKRSTIKIGINAGGLFSEEKIFLNETTRLGGNKRLRGFDEESIFSTLFSIATLEYRLLIAENSYIYAFGDYGYVENTSVDNRLYDQPFGFGAGMTFETSVGIFGISYALGSQQNNPIDFRSGKIHFGYVSLF